VKFADTVRGLLRRWYIVFPGILIAAALAVGAWFAILPGYNRTATQLLIPGASSIPEGANPYLFLGGLAPAADVLVRALGSENVLNEMTEEHPGVEISISRDTTTAGPIIQIAVKAHSDSDAEKVLGLLVERTATVLEQFQEEENIPAGNRMTVIPITVDKQSVLEQRNRILGAAGAGISGIVLTLLLAGLVDGLSQQRKRRESASSGNDTAEPRPDDAVGVIDPVAAGVNPPPDPSPDDQSDNEHIPAVRTLSTGR
jgi:hypothetical protein